VVPEPFVGDHILDPEETRFLVTGLLDMTDITASICIPGTPIHDVKHPLFGKLNAKQGYGKIIRGRWLPSDLGKNGGTGLTHDESRSGKIEDA
jgi:hypothetical protein